MKTRMKITLLTSCLLASVAHAANPIVLADFEGKDYGAWKTTGTAFGTGPAHGTLPGQMNVDGFLGKGLEKGVAGVRWIEWPADEPPRRKRQVGRVISRHHSQPPQTVMASNPA